MSTARSLIVELGRRNVIRMARLDVVAAGLKEMHRPSPAAAGAAP
jgi:hypothetical protein